jgi:hypothetical protein
MPIITSKLGFSIPEFCQLHDISEAHYYALQKAGLGPRVMRVGARRIISAEEAARWRAARTEAEVAEAEGHAA